MTKKIFRDKQINLISIASYDNFHCKQILKAIKSKKYIYRKTALFNNYRIQEN